MGGTDRSTCEAALGALAIGLVAALGLAGCSGAGSDAERGDGTSSVEPALSTTTAVGPTSSSDPGSTTTSSPPDGPVALLQVPGAEDLGKAVGEPVYFRIPQPNLVGPAGPCGAQADAAPDLRVQLMDASQSRFLIDIALAEASSPGAADEFAAAAAVDECEWEAGGDDVRSAPDPDATAALVDQLPEGVDVTVRAEVATDSGGREVTATRVVLRSGLQLLVLHAAGVTQEQALAMVPAAVVR